jgi:hypothetical protein
MDFLNHMEGGYGFLSGFPPFSFSGYSRNCKRLSEFEEIEIPRQSCRDDCDFIKEFSLSADIRPTNRFFDQEEYQEKQAYTRTRSPIGRI